MALVLILIIYQSSKNPLVVLSARSSQGTKSQKKKFNLGKLLLLYCLPQNLKSTFLEIFSSLCRLLQGRLLLSKKTKCTIFPCTKFFSRNARFYPCPNVLLSLAPLAPPQAHCNPPKPFCTCDMNDHWYGDIIVFHKYNSITSYIKAWKHEKRHVKRRWTKLGLSLDLNSSIWLSDSFIVQIQIFKNYFQVSNKLDLHKKKTLGFPQTLLGLNSMLVFLFKA